MISTTIAFQSKAQLGATFNQSTYLSSVGVMYEFNDRIRPELRLGLNENFVWFESNTAEFAINYDIINKVDYEFYSGIAFLYADNMGQGLMIPLGLNIYPFENKQFGFNIEGATLFDGMITFIPRWGFRYKFNKQ
jgi:hypothetical protein